jgi:transposase
VLPPSEPGTGPSDADPLQTIPGIGPHTAAALLGELGAPTRFTDAPALVACVGFYPVITESGQHVGRPRLSAVGSRIARRALYLYSQRDSEMIVALKHVEYRGRAVSSDGRAPDF